MVLSLDQYILPEGVRHSFDLMPYVSIVRATNSIRSFVILAQCAKDYADTLSLVGARIRTRARNESDVDGMEDTKFERSMTKGLVELYLGCGDNVRKTIKDITDINQILNGPKDDGLSGLGALAAAIASSRQPAPTTTVFDTEDGED